MGKDMKNMYILHQSAGMPMRLDAIPIGKGKAVTGAARPTDARNYSVVVSPEEFDRSTSMTPPALRNK
jgi:hypothetical protein